MIITGRDPATLESARKEIGEGTLAIRSEVQDLAAQSAVIDQVRQKYGRIDGAVRERGHRRVRAGGRRLRKSCGTRSSGVNLKGPYFLIQKALPLMGKGGSIVLTSSIGHRKGLMGNSVYAASKAGLRSLARNLGAEPVGRGIRVNCVSPGADRYADLRAQRRARKASRAPCAR